jgi:hypothetical protein
MSKYKGSYFLSIFLLLVFANIAKADGFIPGKERDYSEPKFIYDSILGRYEYEFSEVFFSQIFIGLIIVIICLSVAALLVARARKKNKKNQNKNN